MTTALSERDSWIRWWKGEGNRGEDSEEGEGNSGEDGGYHERRLTLQTPISLSHVRNMNCLSQKEQQDMRTYSRWQQGRIGVLGGAVLVTAIGCSTPLSTREKGALIGGGAGAGAGALIGGGVGAAIGGA
jgi:hypothetical protein